MTCGECGIPMPGEFRVCDNCPEMYKNDDGIYINELGGSDWEENECLEAENDIR